MRKSVDETIKTFREQGIIVISQPGNEEVPALFFELGGICDLQKNAADPEAQYRFFNKGHPRFYKPSMVVPHSRLVFSFYFATQRVNEGVSWHLLPNDFIAKHQQEHPFIIPTAADIEKLGI